MVLLRPLMATRSMAYIVVLLTLAAGVLALPNIGLYYGVQNWTARLTGGVVDARFIAVIDTTLGANRSSSCNQGPAASDQRELIDVNVRRQKINGNLKGRWPPSSSSTSPQGRMQKVAAKRLVAQPVA